MRTAADIRGTVFKNGSAVLLARIVGPNDDAVVDSELQQLRYSVLQVDHASHDSLIPISGHEDVELVVGDVFYDSLQTGGPWSVDAVGYNFRHELDISTNQAFPVAGLSYQVRYEATPVVGQPIVWRYLVRAI